MTLASSFGSSRPQFAKLFESETYGQIVALLEEPVRLFWYSEDVGKLAETEPMDGWNEKIANAIYNDDLKTIEDYIAHLEMLIREAGE